MTAALAGGINGEPVPMETPQPRRTPHWKLPDVKPSWYGPFGSGDEAKQIGWKPYLKPQLVKLEPVSWVAESERRARERAGATRGFMFSGAGLPCVSKFPERLERFQCSCFVAEAPSTNLMAGNLAFAVRTPPTTKARELPPSIEELPPVLRDWADGRPWEDLFEPGVLDKSLLPFVRANKKDALYCERGRRDDTQPPRLLPSRTPGHRERQRAGKKSSESRLSFEGYVPTARIILLKGFVFEVDEEGRVRVLGEEPFSDAEFSFERNLHLAYLDVLAQMGPGTICWPDEQLRQLLVRGADDDSDGRPPICSLSSNHCAASEKPHELVALIAKDQRKGFMSRPSSRPPFVPFNVTAGNIIFKSEECGVILYRKVADATWPRLTTLYSTVAGIPLAPSLHSYKGSDSVFFWCNSASLAQSVEVLARMLDGSGYKVVGCNSDKANWFRQIPQARRDRYKSVSMVNGEFIRDYRLILGKATAAHQGDRLTTLSVDYLEHRYDAEIEGFLKKMPKDLLNLYLLWDEGRVQAYEGAAEAGDFSVATGRHQLVCCRRAPGRVAAAATRRDLPGRGSHRV